MIEKRRTFFQHLFGDDMGDLVGFMAGFFALMAVMMSPMLILSLWSGPKNRDVEVLSKLPKDSQDLIRELASVRQKTQALLGKFEADARLAETLVQSKHAALEDLQRKIELLRLTPEQLQVVEQYNRSVSSDFDLKEWVSRKTTWYEFVVTMLVSYFFYRLGQRRGRASTS